MKFSPKIRRLALKLPCPLYAVGGYVRNFLIDRSYSSDIDLAAPISAEKLMPYLKDGGFKVNAVYSNTGTVKFSERGQSYEFTSFRTESYRRGGVHTPDEVRFTDDITADALRRDFTCNAVYYDIKEDKIADPLCGIDDIRTKTVRTVKAPKDVFSHDGLRLMRLARFIAELDFTPTEEVLLSAKSCADNIREISAERIYAELKMIVVSDLKYPFSAKDGCYKGLKVLKDIGVLDRIFPQVFNNGDCDKILRATCYLKAENRLFALFYGVQKEYKVFCNGEKVEDAFKRIKADNRTVKTVKLLLLSADIFEKKIKEDEIRIAIFENYGIIERLFCLENALRLAETFGKEKSETVKKWRDVCDKMQREGVPFAVKDLKITPVRLKELGVKDNEVGKTLKDLQRICVLNASENDLKNLEKRVISQLKVQNL